MFKAFYFSCVFKVDVFLQENVGQSVKLFIEQISSKPTKVAILGPFYSSQAKVVAETASYYNLLQVWTFDFLFKCSVICSVLYTIVSIEIKKNI